MTTTCTLCENPYPYQCPECNRQIEMAIQEDAEMFENACAVRVMEETPSRRIYVGSGEDVCLDLL